jgi:uridine kinase
LPDRSDATDSRRKPVVIGIAGGTGSGKTTVALKVKEHFGDESVIIIHHDSYYLDRSDMPFEERAKINYDHPSAFENTLLVEHLTELSKWQSIEKPIYNYETHARRKETVAVGPADIVLLEGILVLSSSRLREIMDIKLYVDTDADERFIRRLRRDMNERGRSVHSVIEQYMRTVRPMHLQFVEPSKRYADLIIPEGGLNRVAIDVITAKIRDVLSANGKEGSRLGRG